MKKLSICIPTYNRSEELDIVLSNLKKIISIPTKKMIEIVISDNASEDRTEEIVDKYKNDLEIIYSKNLKNMKFDYNLENVSKLATGEYIWFCGDDDIIKNGSIEKILQYIEYKNDIYILNGNIKNKKMDSLTCENLKIFNTKNECEFLEYINSIKNNLSFFLAFITSIVVKRELYMENKIKSELKNSAYDHVYKCLSILKRGCKLMYLDEIYYDVGINENEWNVERGKHFLLDISSYYKFINNLYGDKGEKIRKSIGKLFNRSCGKIGLNMIYNYNYAKIKNRDKELKNMLDYFYMNSYKNNFYRKFLSNKVMICIIDKLLIIYRKIKKSGGKDA